MQTIPSVGGRIEPQVNISVRNVELRFGGVEALRGVDLDMTEGQITALVGPNGAGKTCILNCINGYYRPQRGHILFNGRDLVGLSPDRIAQLGIARTFQNVELFTGMSTVENLMLARHIKMKSGVATGMLFFGPAQREEMEHRRVVEEIIDFLEIEHVRDQVVGLLPYGLRKRVELGRALALEPTTLLLDEPMAGMNLEEKEDMARFILDVREVRGTTILLVEHDMGLVMDISDYAYVLDFGEKIAEGPPAQIAKDPKVISAYLGHERG